MPPMKSAATVEPWLRGTLTEVPAEQRAVLHALELAREDIARWCAPLSQEEMHARPYGLGSVAFHLRHVAGSLDRLLTYAEGNILNETQTLLLAAEMNAEGSSRAILTEFERGLRTADERVRAIDLGQVARTAHRGPQKAADHGGGFIDSLCGAYPAPRWAGDYYGKDRRRASGRRTA